MSSFVSINARGMLLPVFDDVNSDQTCIFAGTEVMVLVGGDMGSGIYSLRVPIQVLHQRRGSGWRKGKREHGLC